VRLLDRIVIAGIVFLLVGTPLILPAGESRQVHIAGTAAFVLFFLWMVKLLAGLVAKRSGEAAIPATLKSILAPLVVVIGLLAFQIVPLPSPVVRVISAPTYHLYQRCLSGWPLKLDYDLEGPANSRPVANAKVEKDDGVGEPTYSLARTLSIAPSFTKSSLLIGAASMAFFMVAAFYPFGAGNASATRKLIGAMLFSGILVASIGLLERAFWNGKILWLFVPEAWGGPKLEMARAIGPYANADHFANYLGMIFPFALAGVLFPWPSGYQHGSLFVRIACAGALILIAAAVLLSLSRAVWLAIPISMAVFWRMVSPVLARKMNAGLAEPAPRHSHRRREPEGRSWNASRAIGRLASKWWLVYGASLAIFAVAFLWIAGPAARTSVDQRLGASFVDMSLIERLRLSRDTLPMIAGFPLFGVGLGNWAEIFPHFISPPSSVMWQNHAHNDYLELAAEIGVAGIVAVSWLGWRLIASLRSAAGTIGPLQWPWFAAAVSAVVFAAVHELFEFNLHTTPNVFLFCALAATAVRLATPSDDAAVEVSRSTMFACASVGAFGAPVLALLAATHHPMTFDLWPTPENRRKAVDQIVSYPADVRPHLSLARFDQAATPQAMREFEIATWLDPHDPTVRDSYVQLLVNAGLEKAATEQMEMSVMYSPGLDHPYLTKELVATLSSPERRAIETGFRKAMTRGYPGALDALAGFYALSDRPVDVAELYLQAASQQQDADRQERFLLTAGEAFSKAGKVKEAQSAFEKAASLEPSDAPPYLDLLSEVYGPSKDMDSARSTVETGIARGADPIVLYTALAQAAQAANRPEVAGAALKEIVQYAPTVENNARLAQFYLASGKPDLAVDTMRKVTTIEPDSADAYVRLAVAEEAAYLYADADRDYSHALSLEPNNPEVKSRYAEFQKRTADKGASALDDTGK
jgi:tetratricopeptide (TPR) repeat protein/O-antigen ligase